jgi:MSHA biogenesis protein MshL
MMKKHLLTSALLALGGCSASFPPVNDSPRQAIGEALQSAQNVPTAAPAAMPAAVSASLLPPLRYSLPRTATERLDPRFDLVVAEAPIQQVLSAIVSGTSYSILLRPRQVDAATTSPIETVTVNLKNVTVFEALNAMRELLGYEYTVEGNRITVQPPELTTRVFQLNYVQGKRRGVSDLRVVSGASASASTGGGSSSSGGYGSTQASALSTQTESDLWTEVEDAMRTVLGCDISAAAAPAAPAAPSGGDSASRSAPAPAASTASTSRGNRGRAGCPGGRALTVNPMSGTILMRAMPSELRMAQQLLRSMQMNVERQVIIEAKIIDVELNASAQQGINWAGFKDGLHRFSVGANPSLINSAAMGGGAVGSISTSSTDSGSVTTVTSPNLSSLLGSNLASGSGGAFSAGLGIALQLNNFSALINFLQTQGQVHVLSSPRIATLNNQKAVLKVGSEESFVTNISGGTSEDKNNSTTKTDPTLTYQPFFSGISLDVTPQIDDNGNITLHVHSLINSITEKQKKATPGADSALVPFAVNNINETDSVIRTRDNQVVVIGGLMTESMQDSRSRVPGAGEAPVVGSLFRKGGQQSVKRELVILLKPTVVRDDSAWQNDIAASRSRIDQMNSAPIVLSNGQP